MLRKIIVNVHTYGGLLCFSYLILLGISVLNFNHRYAFTLSPGSVTTWTQPMTLPELARIDGKAGADALQMRGDNNQMILHALGSFAARSPNPDGSWTGPDTLIFSVPARNTRSTCMPANAARRSSRRA